MSDNLFDEYKDYYRTRAERYADNPNYRNSYEAEKNLRDAFISCTVMDEFRTKVGDHNYKCAAALIKDKFLMEQAFYKELEEIIRIKASEKILSKIVDISDVTRLSTMVSEELNKNSIEISMDEANRQFHYDWGLTDNVEIYENAVVPDEYKPYMSESVNSFKESINDNLTRLEENNSHWQKGWKLTPDIITEHRHRQLLPYEDEHVAEQLKKYKSITNR
jgi:hypothetical protein